VILLASELFLFLDSGIVLVWQRIFLYKILNFYFCYKWVHSDISCHCAIIVRYLLSALNSERTRSRKLETDRTWLLHRAGHCVSWLMYCPTFTNSDILFLINIIEYNVCYYSVYHCATSRHTTGSAMSLHGQRLHIAIEPKYNSARYRGIFHKLFPSIIVKKYKCLRLG